MTRTTQGTAWYETFFDNLYARVLDDRGRVEASDDQAREIRKALGLRKGARVLDVGCGLGRVSLALARLGMDVTGVDLQQAYVRRARKAATAEGLEAEFVRADMRELPFGAEFHAVVNWFTSFGYFDDAGNLAAARSFLQALRPGGQLLLEVMNKSWMLAHWREADDVTINGVRVRRSSRWNAETSRAEDRWTLSRGSRCVSTRLSLRAYNGTEMRNLLQESGFGDIRMLGRPGLGRFTRHSRRMLALARRPR